MTEPPHAADSSLGSAATGLVGRDAELAVVSGAVRELCDGRASVVALEGEAGIGKTRLVDCLVDEARWRGVTVFRGEAHPFERTRPFGVIADALGVHRRSADPRRAAIGTLLTGEQGMAGADLRYRVVEEIVDLVEASSAEHPVLLVAEDLQWADGASLTAILSVIRQLPLATVLVVVTSRPSPLPVEAVRLLDDLASLGARTLHLEPLQPDELVVLAQDLVGAAPGPRLVEMLSTTGGSPLWAVSLLRSLVDGGMLRHEGARVEPTTFELPDELSDLVVRTLRPLPTPTIELLEVAAVLGDAVSLRDVTAVAQRPAAEVVTHLRDAFEARLLVDAGDRVVFRHQLVHDAVYQHMPPAARRLLHREGAVALVAAGADRLDVAHHLMLGSERGDEQVITWLREAAREASPRSPAVAVELLRRLESLLPHGHRDTDLVATEVVQAMLRAGEVAEASARAEAVLGRPHVDEVDTPLRLALVGALALQNRAAELIDLVETSLAHARLRPADQVSMLAQQSWALTYGDDPPAGEAAAERALTIAERTGDATMTVWASTALNVAVGRQGRFDEALAHAQRAAALAASSPDMASLPLQPTFMLGLALVDCDQVEKARAAFRQTLDGEFGSGWWHSDALMADSQAAFALGEWGDALPGLIAGGHAAEERQNPMLVMQSLAYRTIIATGTGDLRAADELASPIAASLEAEALAYNAGILASAVAGLRMAEGDRAGAYELLLRCWRFDAGRESRYYHRCLGADLVRLALALGHRDVAVEVADTVAAGVALAPDVATVRSLALRCRGLVEDDVEPLLEAVALTRGTSLLLEHTGGCEDAATSLVRARKETDAAVLLSEALDHHERAGADAWARRARGRLRTLGARPGTRGPRQRPTSGWDSLTPTEQAVSQLVAEGLTNGAVAKRLYVSPHTVNTHLRHAFAKLGVTNRVALAAEVHRTNE